MNPVARSTPSPFTLAAHDVHDERHQGAVAFPIYQNTLFTSRTHEHPGHPYTYSRGANPTVEQLERKLALLEGGEQARCFASGMAAISAAIVSQVRQGDHILCTHQAYSGTKAFLQHHMARYGVRTTFVDAARVDALEAAALPNTALLYLESPTSFVFELQPLRECAEWARSKSIRTVIDNTWATPCFQKPLALGIDLVVHSLSKYVGGHSDALGGAVIGGDSLVSAIGREERLNFGGIMTPQVASLMMRGLRTLPLRMERAHGTGLAVAGCLSDIPHLRVHYPGLPGHPQYEWGRRQMSGYGSLLSFECDQDAPTMYRWADRLRYFRIGGSWGGYESLAVVLGNASAFGGGSERCLVRLYCGLEEPGDLIDDLQQAFEEIHLI